MLDTLGGWLVDYLKPCKKCLVQATCRPFKVDCDSWNQFINQRDRVESIGNNIETYILLAAIIIGMLLIAATFGLGIVKWSEMIF